MGSDEYVVNVQGAVVRDEEYLLIERAAEEDHAGGKLGFPGGKVEQEPGGEATIEATARRELREEVGVEVGTVEYVLSRTFEADDGTRCLNIVTLCEHESSTARPRSPAEVVDVFWLSTAEIADREDAPDYLERDVKRIDSHRHSGSA
ncbi:NUDIX hydrolase [Halosolutus gelatinilyticus]|uniref:NUDIX hydrolase n=1 Tax=Halosolutus gelatinilyticus TaxID=2931975 RepID=UPI001FF6F9CB|nr:NUDIX domain-containing protein [Halosolutus gelatinilyticus]